jgi:hypothetical protein
MKACIGLGAEKPNTDEGMRGHIRPFNSIFVFDSLGELPFDTQEEKGGTEHREWDRDLWSGINMTTYTHIESGARALVFG